MGQSKGPTGANAPLLYGIKKCPECKIPKLGAVVDAERMLSYLVASFHIEHKYKKEGKLVRTAGWHEAADGRGLSELEGCQKNYETLNMILDEWMPWQQNCT